MEIPDRRWAGLRNLATLPEALAALQPDRLRAHLAGAVHEFAHGDLVLHDCQPRHFRRKSDAWTFLCQVTVGSPAGRQWEVWVEGSLRATDVAGRSWRGAMAFGSKGWHCLLPELGLELRTAPPDTALPLVPELMDSERARVLLEDAIRTGTPAYADLRIAACRPQVMRYARGSRCTIRYELDHLPEQVGRGWPGMVVAKTYRDDRGQNAYHGMRALWSSELSRSSAVAIAEPLAYLPELRVLVQGPVAGDRTLKDLICSWLQRGTPAALDELSAYLARAAEGLAALHGCGVAYGETVTLECEVAEIRSRIERLARFTPELSGAAAPLLARVVHLAAEHPADSVRPSHGTFRPAQVLLHQGLVGFIDFDGFCRAEPALDVARFRAGIKDCGMRAQSTAGVGIPPSPEATTATMTALEAVCDRFLRCYEAVAPVSRDRVMLWETLDLLTYVIHAWTRMSPARLRAEMLTLEEHVHNSGLVSVPQRSEDLERPGHTAEAA
jgi:hypothetical protein